MCGSLWHGKWIRVFIAEKNFEYENNNILDRYAQEQFVYNDYKTVFISEVVREWLMEEVKFGFGLEA